MTKATAYPYIAVHISGVESFVVGLKGVKEFAIGPGMTGTALLIVQYEGEEGSERRFMVPPSMLAFECGPGVEMDVPDATQAPKPTLLVPEHVAADRIRRQ